MSNRVIHCFLLERKVVLLSIFFTLLFLPRIIFAQQEMRFERITPEKGFPGIIVYSILQDHQGFMWFATMSGLIKYDGYKFTTYRYDNADSGSLRSYDSHSLYEDKFKNLWIGANGVLSRYKREEDNFEHYYVEKGIRQPAQIIHSICEDDYDNLYLGAGRYGFYRFNIKNKTFTKYGRAAIEEPHLRSGWTGSLCRDNNIIWIVSGDGLKYFNIGNQTFENYKHIPGNRKSLSSNNTYCFHHDKSGVLWIGTFNGLNKFDKSTGSFEVFGINDDSTGILNKTDIFYVTEPENGKLWLLTSSGLIIFDKTETSLTSYNHEPENPLSLSTNFLWYAYKDKSGIVWIGTQFGGVNKYNPEQSKFTHYKHDKYNDNTITGGFVRAILQDRSGTIWVGTVQGLNQFDIYNNKVKRYQEQTGGKNTISDNNISSLCEDSEGNLWIGTMNGLNCLEKQRRNFTVYMPDIADTNSLAHNMIAALYEDRYGDLWIGTQGGGIEKFNREQKSFKHYRLVYGDTNCLSSESINSFYEDKYGDFWVCTWGGLNKFDRANGIFKAYYYSESGVEPLIVVHEDKKDRFWVVSWQTGLSLFDRSKKDYTFSFGLEEGLPSNTATDIMEDDKGFLWIGTVNGLSKYNPETGISVNYDVISGLPFPMQWHDAELKDRSGYLYFGGEGGFFRFHPDSLKKNTAVPSVVLTDFKIFNESVIPSVDGPLKENINVADEINLTYKEKIFSIEFAALDYKNPMKNSYAYKLEGFNTDWINTDAQNRMATYTSIDPGEYVFRVKGSNNDGVWNEEGTSIRIIITPPWWQTWWFRGCGILLILAVLEFSRERHMKKVRREIKQKEEFSRQLISGQEQERKRIASDLHDSHAQNLLVLKNRVSLLIRRKDTASTAKEELRDISDGLLHSMDEIRSITYSLRPHEIERFGLTDSLVQIIEKVGEACSIIFKTHIENINGLLKQDDEVILYRIVQECLNNIVKHSGAKTALIKITKLPDSIDIQIKDDGRGFEPERLAQQNKHSLGMTDIRERINLLKGKIDIITSLGKGTSIQLNIPYTTFSNEQET